ncbi:MAG TPA: hypothetical protein PKA13_24615 [Geminicoccaceae bacterium]|nr:hypothetical protein [Geminicoccus sp.]HMU52981.1 hypothetical protein [Geminicoccaceae bacterium]
MAGTGLASAPILALMALLAVLWPERAAVVLVEGSALLLLLVAGHLLVGLVGLPFLGLGGLAALGCGLAALLAEPAGAWQALVLSAVAGGLLMALAVPLLSGSGRGTVAGATLGLGVAASLVPSPAAAVATMPAWAALALAVAGLVLGDRLVRSTIGQAALAAGRDGPQPLAPDGLELLPIAVAGLAAAIAGAMPILFGPLSRQLPPSATLSLSLGTFAAAAIGGRRGLAGVLVAGLPLLVAPWLAVEVWPRAPDLRLPVPAVALLALLAHRAVDRRAA